MGLRGPKPLYDWGEWFKRKSFTAVAGSDYRCTTASFAQQARNAALRLGLRVSVTRVGDRGVKISIREVRRAEDR